jgi:hypothetical protein
MEIDLYQIVSEGKPRVAHAKLLTKLDKDTEAVIVYLSLDSKYTDEILYEYNDEIPCVHIYIGEDTLYVNEVEQDYTTVEFPLLKGWEVIASNRMKYDYYIAFMRVNKDDEIN